MKFNRIALAIAGAAGIALAGACADGGAKLTSPRAPAAAPSVAAPVDTFCCGTQKQTTTATTTATVDTFPKHGN